MIVSVIGALQHFLLRSDCDQIVNMTHALLFSFGIGFKRAWPADEAALAAVAADLPTAVAAAAAVATDEEPLYIADVQNHDVITD